MKLNTRARYALRAMIKIAQNNDVGRPVNLTEIAESTSVSKRYLEQLVIPLKHASLIRGVSGKEGGYLLARSPDDIRVGDIIEASIGPINLVDCVKDPDYCMQTEWCECRPLYVLLNRRIRDAFNSFTLADLADHKIGELVANELESDDVRKSVSSD
jgi:Rrf2 family protein